MRLVTALVVGLVGGALVTFGARRPWEAHQLLAVPTAPPAHESIATSLGAVILVGTLVVGVTRAWGRRLAGLVVALAAAGVLVATQTADADWVAWRLAVLVGALLGVGSGALAAVQGHRWASMSRRYDAPTTRPAHESDPWKALDRGEDPTL